MRVFIMQGIPGAGKDHWIKQLVDTLPVGSCREVFSVDDFWGPEFAFDPARLREAHDWCLRRYINYLTRPCPQDAVVVVNNTNVSVWEVAPYYRVAEALGHEPEIVRVECPPEAGAARNMHGVPAWKVGVMWQTLQSQKHLLPGWWRVTSVPWAAEVPG